MKHKIFSFNNRVTKLHKQFYKKNGYIVFRKVFSRKETKILDKSICEFADESWHNIMNPDRIEFLLAHGSKKLNSFKSNEEKIKFIQKANFTSNLYRSYLIDQRVKKILKGVTGRSVNGLMTHVIFKHKKSKFSNMSWVPHQDNSYAQMENDMYITSNLFIHKANKNNGCLYLYPGSHKFGLLKFKSYYSYHAKLGQKPGNRIKKFISEKNKVDLEIKAGDFLVMNGNLVHGSYPNLSKKLSRHLLSFNYGVVGKKFIPGKTAKRKAFTL